jgi:hypothetical protein
VLRWELPGYDPKMEPQSVRQRECRRVAAAPMRRPLMGRYEPPAEHLANGEPKRLQLARRPSEGAPRPGELLGQNGEAERDDDEAGAGDGYDDEDEPERQDAEAGDRNRDPAQLERETPPWWYQVSSPSDHPMDTVAPLSSRGCQVCVTTSTARSGCDRHACRCSVHTFSSASSVLVPGRPWADSFL